MVNRATTTGSDSTNNVASQQDKGKGKGKMKPAPADEVDEDEDEDEEEDEEEEVEEEEVRDASRLHYFFFSYAFIAWYMPTYNFLTIMICARLTHSIFLVQEEEETFEEIDPSAIIPTGRRTRGVKVDYTSKEALAKAGLQGTRDEEDSDDDVEMKD